MKEDPREEDGGLVAEGDLLAIIDYLDGRLSPEEMIALELRLADSPELATAFDEFEAVDRLERQVAPAARKRSPFRLLSGGPAILLAAAAALVLLVTAQLRGWFAGSPSDPEGSFAVAILPTRATAEAFLEELGVPTGEQGVVPAGFFGTSRGGVSEEEAAEATAAGQRLLARQERWVNEAFARGGLLDPLEYFVVPVRVERERSALVLLVDTAGVIRGRLGEEFQLAYPEGAGWRADTGRLAPGPACVLPEEVVRVKDGDPGDLDQFTPGFLVPRRVEELVVLVALRSEAFDEGLRVSLAELLEALAAEPAASRATLPRLRAWLAEQGFEVEERRIVAA